MKKCILITLLIAVLLGSCVGCNNNLSIQNSPSTKLTTNKIEDIDNRIYSPQTTYKKENVNVKILPPNKFSIDEINNAVNCIITKFNAVFHGGRLLDIWYDENRSISQAEIYIKNGRGTITGAKKENVIILLSDFLVGPESVIGPNTKHEAWMWILIRDSKTDVWRVDDWGY